MIFRPRRAYGAPTLFRLGGGELGGMDQSGRDTLPPESAAWAVNLVPHADGGVRKRGGVRLRERLDIEGRIEWMERLGEATWIYYVGPSGGRLRRVSGGKVSERPLSRATAVRGRQGLYVLAEGLWIFAGTDGSVLMISPDGRADGGTDLGAALRPWRISDQDVTVPLIRAGGRPMQQGKGILPPNLLTPLVSESFVYTAEDREAHHNRFSLSLQPQVVGDLPTAADGTHDHLSESDAAVRRATLSASARLWVRIEQTDAYGNRVSRWQSRSWNAADNINSEEAAVWIHSIHSASLCEDGEDNVRIVYLRPAMEQTEQLLSAVSGAIFGVAGRRDRLFAAAGSRIYYSGMEDERYFGSLQYVELGEPLRFISAQDKLYAFAAHSLWQVEGDAEEQAGEYALDALFAPTVRLPCPLPFGDGCVTAGDEVLFISERGICAVAPSGILDEREIRQRSGRLQTLLEREDPADLRMIRPADLLCLAGKQGMYLLDLRRAHKNAAGDREYEAYYWTDVGAEGFMAGEELLFFRDGNLYGIDEGAAQDEFLSQGALVQSPICAYWESGPLGDKESCGSFRALTMAVPAGTKTRVEALCGNTWRLLFDYDGKHCPFRYDGLEYRYFNYSAHPPAAVRRTLRLAHRRALRLRFTNDLPHSPWGLRSFSVEYK